MIVGLVLLTTWSLSDWEVGPGESTTADWYMGSKELDWRGLAFNEKGEAGGKRVRGGEFR